MKYVKETTMAITGLGMDAVELSRIEKIVAEPKTFLRKVLTPAELEKYNSLPTKRKVEFLAGRFAAKEAYAKALGTGIGQHVSFQDIEVLNDASGNQSLCANGMTTKHGSPSHIRIMMHMPSSY